MTRFLVLDGRQRNLYLRRLQWDIHLWSFLGCRRKSKMLACMFTESEEFVVINDRGSEWDEWLRISKIFQKEEQALKSGMPAGRRKFLESKRLWLMKHIIQESSMKTEILRGFGKGSFACGRSPALKCFALPEKSLPATMTITDLTQNAKKANLVLRYMTRSRGSEDLDQKLWEKTRLEVSKGWLAGPICWDRLPEDATVSRCFSRDQSGEVRPIDDRNKVR